MATIISTKTSGVGGLTVTGDASGVLELASANGTTAVTIAASQNVGIGTSSPSKKLSINGDFRLGDGGGTGAIFTDATVGLRFMLPAAGTSATESMRIDSSGNLLFNSGYGSVATAYGCRAWVNFNGTGTVAIRASGNVSSITDNGTGDYTVNFTTAMPDINYSAVGSCGSGAAGNDEFVLTTNYNTAPTTSATRVGSHRANSGLATDLAWISVAIFR